ncbi:hypothetical protein C923_01341 [Plasmodium falciparum UGT5.1]|uniref:Uncharacterized protein n=12 Tax=Plasmodium falciparum TaxID=5833 RepID=C6KSL9_PLAF7|nr:conserved Plasmodium protein, unknown function [Plasmodium falciparum 3D7]ETW19776.1 hypothetical protein PFFVO_01251 [Plasmodium falciparum Vietnam Oak-Knoll (FVO)]ETW37967.1 hypothetical protein PFTANZ_01310 [Plasmodium falciparum Tanzania (2000708)]ETW44099.1 hypothetical protein PFNF135_01352 [Plasmodium falciparum NF135/5.C10]ETW50546.1 hypothetical protein PFMALIP_01274 [Plasmodium falciparum MaliPS096_E11]ETW53346.1 hypothetical protein PFUGPA_04973 [Plasmodium falciparum Palo Alto/U|eukprot:XP_966009.1 conserved Plasmodium protein, unknown function [Plasmodium falciparum 3D7]
MTDHLLDFNMYGSQLHNLLHNAFSTCLEESERTCKRTYVVAILLAFLVLHALLYMKYKKNFKLSGLFKKSKKRTKMSKHYEDDDDDDDYQPPRHSSLPNERKTSSSSRQAARSHSSSSSVYASANAEN